MIRRQQVSSRELTEILLAHIERVQPALNAVVELRPEGARRDAAAADAALARGEHVGPLHGVPMTIKDCFDVAGLHTTWGNPAFKDYVPERDATLVQRLRQAGTIIVGKSNVAFMLGDFGQTANPLYGVTHNPWDLTRTPGGSSGGAAAAVAAGATFLEYGSDLVGSLRIPASFCGVYGLKPSVGIVPLTGFQPPGPPAPPSQMRYMSAVGPLARSPRDLRAALKATAGPEDPAARSYTWRMPAPRHRRLQDYRVGVVLDDERAPVSSDVGAPLSAAVDTVARAGATIHEGWPAGLDPGAEAESFDFHVRLFFAFEGIGEPPGPVAEVVRQERYRMAARDAWTRYFQDVDVFLCPSNFTAAFPHDDRPLEQRTVATPEGERSYLEQPFWISHASLPGLPAVVAPVGATTDGLPVGAQILGPLFEDDTAMMFAQFLGELTPGYQPPPIP